MYNTTVVYILSIALIAYGAVFIIKNFLVNYRASENGFKNKNGLYWLRSCYHRSYIPHIAIQWICKHRLGIFVKRVSILYYRYRGNNWHSFVKSRCGQ
jgi:hypothetical protein